jgi:acyl-CoA synthetase (NDP forming)
LKAMSQYRRWLEREPGKLPEFKVKQASARKIIDKAIANEDETILGDDAFALLKAYGIPIAKSAQAKTTAELNKALTSVKLPVVMKIDDPGISHKSDVGGVAVGLRTKAEVASAFQTMKQKFGGKKGAFAGVIIQEMVEGGVETIMGMNQDPTFGPVIMFGLGGIFVEILKDVSLKLNPLTDIDAGEMIESIKSYPVLAGARGAKGVKIDILKDTLLKLSQLVSDFPEIKSIDINPFIISSVTAGCKAVDARFILKQH